MSDCIFCNIVKGDFNTTFLYHDDEIVAFNDIAPKAKHHILIMPKQHIETLNDFDASHQHLLGKMMLTAQYLAKELNINESGYRTVMNCNKDGGQEVYHAHLHLLGGEPLSWFK